MWRVAAAGSTEAVKVAGRGWTALGSAVTVMWTVVYSGGVKWNILPFLSGWMV
jgi:hypothetical protein